MKRTTIRAKFPIHRRPQCSGGLPVDARPTTSPHRVALMLALAHHVERLVEAGELSGYSEAAHELGLTRARVTQVMNLLLLAPVVQEALLAGELGTSERGLRAAVCTPEWDLQRDTLKP